MMCILSVLLLAQAPYPEALVKDLESRKDADEAALRSVSGGR